MTLDEERRMIRGMRASEVRRYFAPEKGGVNKGFVMRHPSHEDGQRGYYKFYSYSGGKICAASGLARASRGDIQSVKRLWGTGDTKVLASVMGGSANKWEYHLPLDFLV